MPAPESVPGRPENEVSVEGAVGLVLVPTAQMCKLLPDAAVVAVFGLGTGPGGSAAHGSPKGLYWLPRRRQRFMNNPNPSAKERSKALELAVQTIEKQFGKGAIMRLGGASGSVPVEVTSTGSI